MKLLIDMNLSPQLAGLLADAGYHAVHWSTIGKPDAEDSEILNWQRKMGMSFSRMIWISVRFLPPQDLSRLALFSFAAAMYSRKRLCRPFCEPLKDLPPNCTKER